MSVSPSSLSRLPAMINLARAVATGWCVWFVGAGLSLEGQMPSVYRLTWTVLNNALRQRRGPWDETKGLYLWERLKRLLLGDNYQRFSPLLTQTTPEGMERELQTLEAALDQEEVPTWADRLLNLSRVTEVLERSVPNQAEAAVVLARLLGFEPEPGTDFSPFWDKPPLFTHHLLSLLIKEGRIAILITTNYDELIEKACAEVECPLRVIAKQEDFDERGPAPTTYFKIHGCRAWYLTAWRNQNPEDLKRACEALVVTDRQLQYWRGQHWAENMVKSRLQEHPFFFIGYSASEAVLQNTLNLVASELPQRALERLFIAPELSFPFYQFCTITGPEYDPLDPPNVISAYGKPLLMTLYPMVMGRYFALEAERAGVPTWAQTLGDEGGANAELLRPAYEVAQRLLSEWAEAIGFDLVRTAYPDHVKRSPFARMADSLGLTNEGYIPLANCCAEYRGLVQSFARMLAFNFPTVESLRGLRGKPNAAGSVLDLNDGSKVIKVAIIPCRIEAKPTPKVLTWLRVFLDTQSHRGITGTFAFIVNEGLEEQEQRIWKRLPRYGDFQFQLWDAAGSFIGN